MAMKDEAPAGEVRLPRNGFKVENQERMLVRTGNEYEDLRIELKVIFPKREDLAAELPAEAYKDLLLQKILDLLPTALQEIETRVPDIPEPPC